MRISRKIALLAVMALAVMGIAASSASALEVVDEATGEHCGAVTAPSNGHGAGSGGCTLSASNEGRIELGTPLGMIDCDNIFQGRVGENGQGFIYGHNLFNCSPNTVDECKESGVPDNWPVGLTSETTMEATFCVVAFGFLTVNCHLEPIQFNQISHTEGEAAVDANFANHVDCENNDDYSVRGHWTVSAPSPGLEVMD